MINPRSFRLLEIPYDQSDDLETKPDHLLRHLISASHRIWNHVHLPTQDVCMSYVNEIKLGVFSGFKYVGLTENRVYTPNPMVDHDFNGP